MTVEAYWESRDKRRWKVEEKAFARLERQMDTAERMIGQLCREGKTVHYVYPVGGRYREGSASDLAAFLIRNRYV